VSSNVVRSQPSPVSGRRSLRRALLLALAAVVALVLSGCGPDGGSSNAAGGGAADQPQESVAPTPPAKLSFTPADGTKSFRLDKKVQIGVEQGTLKTVTVTPEKGSPLEGTIAADGTSWKSTGTLISHMPYTITVTAADADGKTAEETSAFTTLNPSQTAGAWLQPSDGANVGVGMPVIFNFDRAIADDKQDNVEEALTVTSEPAVEGAFRWFSDKQVQWRPKEYWPSGTKVHAASTLAGVQLAKGVWGKEKANEIDFTIGSSMISTVDVNAHTMTVRKDGKVIKTIPVTTGKASMATRNGVKVIMSRETTHQMNSETIGIAKDDPDYYNINVKYAMRLTYSGEFIHAAPWSTGSQGAANVSHGCTGMSTANAKWMFDHSKLGDVVVYKGSKRPLEWGNGYTAWDMSYKAWKA